jgi:hypothetical protein
MLAVPGPDLGDAGGQLERQPVVRERLGGVPVGGQPARLGLGPFGEG